MARRTAVLPAFALLLAACGGSSGVDPDDTGAETTTSGTTSDGGTTGGSDGTGPDSDGTTTTGMGTSGGSGSETGSTGGGSDTGGTGGDGSTSGGGSTGGMGSTGGVGSTSGGGSTGGDGSTGGAGSTGGIGGTGGSTGGDPCPGPDADLDGVPDVCDLCAGADDALDADTDGVPDGCDKEWGSAVLLDQGTFQVIDMAVDLAGNAIVVYGKEQVDPNQTDIWTARYAAGAGWGAPALLASGTDGGHGYPAVDVDDDGNAIAVWTQWKDLQDVYLWASRYVPGVGWGVAEDISQGRPQRLGFAMNGSGSGRAVWGAYDAGLYTVWTARYEPGTGWDAAESIAEPATQPHAFRVGVDGGGDATVMWGAGGTYDGMYTNRYQSGAGWDGVENHGVGWGHDLAVNAAGRVAMVWSEQIEDVHARLHDGGASWGTVEQIEPWTGTYSDAPKVVLDPAGNVTAVWNKRTVVPGVSEVLAARYVPGTGWGDVEKIGDGAGAAQLASDDDGNVVAIWGASTEIMASRYVDGIGWGAPETIGQAPAMGSVTTVDVGMAASGDCVALFNTWDGVEQSLWANRCES